MNTEQRTVKSLLFSDVKGFSKLDEKSCLAFCRSFTNGMQNSVLSKYADWIDHKNTWGDALYLVFRDPAKAGCAALDIQDWMQNYEWPGLAAENRPKMRIGLHVGVVTQIFDPILERLNYVGRNTSKAARIEPITEEGQIYVSAAFAAFTALDPECPFTCEYVGMRELPKQYGSMDVYMLQRR